MLNYNKITLKGEGIFDYVFSLNKVASQSEIDEVNNVLNYKPSWNGDTSFLAQLDNNLNGGSMSGIIGNVEKWLVYKRKVDDKTLTFVGETTSLQTYMVDHNIENNTEYIYLLYAVTNRIESVPAETQKPISTDWDYWHISDLIQSERNGLYFADVNNQWKFNTALSSNSLDQTMDKVITNNLTQYPKVSIGKMNYLTGGITALLNNVVNGQYSDNIDMQRQFNKFIANGNLKLLKDRKGNTLIVTTNTNGFQYEDITSEQMTTVSFTFTEIEHHDNIAIVERG